MSRHFYRFLARAIEHETDPQVRRFVERFRSIQDEQERVTLQRAMAPRYGQRGRCDFCGIDNVAVRRDFETELATVGQQNRHAYTCANCDGAA